MYNQQEVFFTCPYCFEHISFVLETDYGDQEYIEDCEVCCRPIQIHYTCNEDFEIQLLSTDRAQD